MLVSWKYDGAWKRQAMAGMSAGSEEGLGCWMVSATSYGRR